MSRRSRPIDSGLLWSHVESLAVVPRPAGSQELERARQYVSGHLETAGCQVSRHPFTAFDQRGQPLDGINVVAHWPGHFTGTAPRLVVGAHLDSTPETPGADDNASAVAALLEIARSLGEDFPADSRFELELVAFDLEELGMLGGAAHADALKHEAVDLQGMVSLEMLGFCDPTPGAQFLPPSLEGLYPDTGDFIAVIGNTFSQPLIDGFASAMLHVDGLAVETFAVPGNGELLPATRLSDHSPFWDAGFQALMITDTSFMRNPHYHLPSDTPDTLDRHFLELVTAGCLEAVVSLVEAGLDG